MRASNTRKETSMCYIAIDEKSETRLRRTSEMEDIVQHRHTQRETHAALQAGLRPARCLVHKLVRHRKKLEI